jgi:hypothetical protein
LWAFEGKTGSMNWSLKRLEPSLNVSIKIAFRFRRTIVIGFYQDRGTGKETEGDIASLKLQRRKDWRN